METQKSIPSYLNDFLEWLDLEKGLSVKTQENYSRFLKKFFDWLDKNGLGNLTPQKLNIDHIWNYRVYLSRQPKKLLKKNTQNYYLIAIRSLLTFFVERSIPSLAPENIKLAKTEEKRAATFLSLDQVEKLLAMPNISKQQGLRDRAILETFFSTGMRISELVNLNRNQIKASPGTKDLELSIIGKGSRQRVVYISEKALNWLKKYLEARKDKEKSLFNLSPRSIQKIVKKYTLLAGLPFTTTPHTIRHSFATDLLSKGADLRMVQEFLGHKSIAATQIYTHITNKRLRDIHRQLHG